MIEILSKKSLFERRSSFAVRRSNKSKHRAAVDSKSFCLFNSVLLLVVFRFKKLINLLERELNFESNSRPQFSFCIDSEKIEST